VTEYDADLFRVNKQSNSHIFVELRKIIVLRSQKENNFIKVNFNKI